MKRLLLLAVLFSSLLTAGAQTDKSQRHKTTPQTHATPSKPATPKKTSTPSKSTPSKKQSQPTKHSTPPSAPKPKAPTGPTLSKPSGSYGGHDYVDLGLPSGTLWATCNVGASKPTENGDYFSWGETKSKKFYDWDTYFDTSDGGKTFSKYNAGGKTELVLSDDAAYANWGSGWRMPSPAQQDELREKCIWTWYSKNGVSGYVVESKFNDSSLFLPAAGYYNDSSLNGAGSIGDYWSRSLNASYSNNAYGLYFNSGKVNRYYSGRLYGQSVRPVRQN